MQLFINFPWILLSVIPTTRAVVGGSGGATGAQRWKLNPNIGGGKNKNRSFGVPGTAGTNFVFRENIFKKYFYDSSGVTNTSALLDRFAAHRLNDEKHRF